MTVVVIVKVDLGNLFVGIERLGNFQVITVESQSFQLLKS